MDMWSFGVMAYELLAGRMFFDPRVSSRSFASLCNSLSLPLIAAGTD